MSSYFTVRNADSALSIWTWYFDFWTGLEVRGRSLLVLPHLLTMWTLVLMSWALVGEVVLKILSQNFDNLVIVLTLISTGQEGVVA